MKIKHTIAIRATALKLAAEIHPTRGIDLFKYAETIYSYLIGLEINSITNENPDLTELSEEYKKYSES